MSQGNTVGRLSVAIDAANATEVRAQLYLRAIQRLLCDLHDRFEDGLSGTSRQRDSNKRDDVRHVGISDELSEMPAVVVLNLSCCVITE